MSRKGIPKKRIGPGPGNRERSIRMRRKGVKGRALNAAERNTYGHMSVSLCGINPVMTKSFYGGKRKKRKKQ